jgi:N-acetylneuraminic acid mutarotase
MVVGRMSMAVSRVENEIYVFGGAGAAASESAESYNITTDQWTQLP